MSNELCAKMERAAIFVGCGSISSFAVPRKQLPPCIFSITSDSKTDSKTGGQQWISVDRGGHAIGLWRGWKTLVDGGRRGVPKGGLGTMNVAVVLFDQNF